MADVINALGDAQCLLAGYHRTILKHKDEDLQDIFNPHMAEIAQIWKVTNTSISLKRIFFELPKCNFDISAVLDLITPPPHTH
eukprot:UN03422